MNKAKNTNSYTGSFLGCVIYACAARPVTDLPGNIKDKMKIFELILHQMSYMRSAC